MSRKVEAIGHQGYTPDVILNQVVEKDRGWDKVIVIGVNSESGEIEHIRSTMGNLECIGLLQTMIHKCLNECLIE